MDADSGADDVDRKGDEEGRKGSSHILLRLAVSIVALSLIFLRIYWPEAFERFDEISVILLVIALLPWGLDLFQKISIPGVLVAELRDKVERSNQTAEQAYQQARETALNTEELYLESQQARPMAAQPSVPESPAPAADVARNGENREQTKLAALAETYMDVRKRMKSGGQRTTQMTRLFRQMLENADRLPDDWADYREWIGSGDAGRNLAAIAHAYGHFTHVEIGPLIACVARSKQPFVHYWALRVIKKAVEENGLAILNQEQMSELKKMEKLIPARTDRHILIRSINDTVGDLLAGE